MIPEIVAMFSAMGWAGDSVLVRLGVRRSNIFAAMLMSYLVSVTCIWTYLVATTPLVFLSSPAMVYFLISGCLQPLFARALFYEGITRIGVARAGPLRGAEPLFADPRDQNGHRHLPLPKAGDLDARGEVGRRVFHGVVDVRARNVDREPDLVVRQLLYLRAHRAIRPKEL